MNPTPTLEPARRARLRTFLIAEVAPQSADSPSRVGLSTRRLAAGAVAALALGSVLAVSTLRPDGTDAALAITTQGAWTSVQLSDVDADAQTVVDELVAAGIDARIAPQWSRPEGYRGLTVLALDDRTSEATYGLSILIPRISGPLPPGTNMFELLGVRLDGPGDDTSFSIRSDSDALVLVHPKD